MKRQIITDVVQQMLPHLDNAQLKQLQKVLECTLFGCDITKQEEKETTNDNPKLIDSFISAKRIEGCSEKTLKYYRTTIETMELAIDKSIRHIQTEDLRSYLTGYQSKNQSSRVTIDNIRRILSSFFSWLEDEDYILKSPVRRIHKVKTATNIKETYTDEENAGRGHERGRGGYLYQGYDHGEAGLHRTAGRDLGLRYGLDTAHGIVNQKVLPFPSSDSTPIFP